MIRNIQLSHGGKYVCLIDTDVESLSTSAILVVKGTRATLFLECVYDCAWIYQNTSSKLRNPNVQTCWICQKCKVSELPKGSVNKSLCDVKNKSPSIPVKVATVYLLSAERISFLTVIDSHDLNMAPPGPLEVTGKWLELAYYLINNIMEIFGLIEQLWNTANSSSRCCLHSRTSFHFFKWSCPVFSNSTGALLPFLCAAHHSCSANPPACTNQGCCL